MARVNGNKLENMSKNSATAVSSAVPNEIVVQRQRIPGWHSSRPHWYRQGVGRLSAHLL